MRDGTAGSDAPWISAARPASTQASRAPSRMQRGARCAPRPIVPTGAAASNPPGAAVPQQETQRSQDALKHHRTRLRLRHVPRRLPGRLGRGLSRTRHPGAAGRSPDRKRDLDHRGRGDHHRRRHLLRAARHVVAPRLGRAWQCCQSGSRRTSVNTPKKSSASSRPARSRASSGASPPPSASQPSADSCSG